MKRRNFTKKLKAKIALEAIKGQRPINEIAQEFEVHPNQIGIWKRQLLDSMPEAFQRGKNQDVENLKTERDRLFRKVGQLQVENDFLKKNLGYLE